MGKMRIKGVIPPMITPFTSGGDVDYAMFANNIERWNQDELCGYLVLGSNSEAVYLTEAEKLKLIELSVRHAKSGRMVLAGTGMESTRETISLTEKAAALGAQAALILTPFYYGSRMTDEALLKYYTTVADNVSIPVLIYNVTKFTHVNISADAVRILSRHPNIIGMKDSSGDIPQLVKFKGVLPEYFNLMVGTASAWYPALNLGVEAGIMALANCAPGECAKVQKLYDQGLHAEAMEEYQRLFPVNSAVTNTYGVAGLKYACTLLGYEGGFVREPLLELKKQEKERIGEILAEARLSVTSFK